VLVLLAALPVLLSAQRGQWPQWRGPDGLGIAQGDTPPLEWTATTNVRWKTEVHGRGLSSPIVWGDRVFLTTSIKGAQVPGRKAPVHLDFNNKPGYVHPDSVDVDYLHTLRVMAFDARTGKVLWDKVAYDGEMQDDRHRKNTYASSTMATDGTLVFAFFESAGLHAYDFDGNLKWKASLGNIIKAGLGPGTSPVLFENLVIIQADQEMGAGSAIVALDRADGREVWRVSRSNRRSWATPLLVKAGDRTELVASGAEAVVAYDPTTGKELWRSNGTRSHPIPSPVAGHGLVYLTAGSQAKVALAMKLGQSGDLKDSPNQTDSPNIAWRYNKGTAYVPSPILVGKYLYLMTDQGLLTCLDALTGTVAYEGGRVPIPATFTASPIAIGDHLLLMSEDGDTFVIKAGPVHEVVRTNPIGEPIFASPGVADGTIYIRGEKHLFAVGR
jgi:outer membrane protein assembly factor BamB